MTTAEALAAARKLIDTPEKWRGLGIVRALPEARFAQCLAALFAHLPKWATSLSDLNEHYTTTHADVMALFERAIAGQERGNG